MPHILQVTLSSSLQELNLGGNKLTDAHLRSITHAISINAGLRLILLTLERNQLTSVEPLVALFPSQLRQLRRLDLDENKLKSGAIRMLADALPAARQLRRVSVMRQVRLLKGT